MTLAEPLPAVNLVAAGIPALVDEVVGSPRLKTQAISVYRKLGVSTRSDAITRMDELGLMS